MDLRQRLRDACERDGVPGAALAVATLDGDVETVCVGTTSVDGGRPVDEHTQFAIGSVTKPMTAELVVSIAAEGRLSLDAAMTDYLPELSSRGWADGITIRHLLSHTSGLPAVQHQLAAFTGVHGLANPDPVEDDGTLARWVSGLGEVDVLFLAGTGISYSNVGFSLAGRICEVVTGSVWDDLMTDRIWGPAGLSRTVTIGRHPADDNRTVGHLPGPDGAATPTPAVFSASAGPAGGSPVSSISDLIAYGARAAAGVEPAMLETHARWPVPDGPEAGLGWVRFGWGAGVFGWDGDANGWQAMLRVVPDVGAVALLTNGANGWTVGLPLIIHLVRQRLDAEPPAPPIPPARAPALPLDDCVGTYVNGPITGSITNDHGRLILESGVAAPVGLVPISSSLFLKATQDAWPYVALSNGILYSGPFGFRRR